MSLAKKDDDAIVTMGRGVRCLVRQLGLMEDSQFEVECDDSDITSWAIHVSSSTLRDHDLGGLAAELDHWARLTNKCAKITLRIRFPTDFPHSVPFLRVVRPRFVWHTGHVTIGGSLCTELLTPSGWRPMTVHALLLTVCEMLRDGAARIQVVSDIHCARPLVDYDEREAQEAYERVARFHGWILPHKKPLATKRKRLSG